MGCDEGGKILVSGLLSETDVSLSTSIPYHGWYFTNSLLHEKHVFYFGLLTELTFVS